MICKQHPFFLKKNTGHQLVLLVLQTSGGRKKFVVSADHLQTWGKNNKSDFHQALVFSRLFPTQFPSSARAKRFSLSLFLW